MKSKLFILAISLMISCERSDHLPTPVLEANLEPAISEEISEYAANLDKAYWYAGKAEVSKFQLSQNRYKDEHDGELVLIFVTEDFLTDKQVKNDNYTNPNSVSVLKTNQLRRFTTGLYDYSMMTSVFTKADGSGTEKITMTSQDWCGHSFVQLNRKKDHYVVELRSYFESEGDQEVKVKADLLEDEILNLLRINPENIKTGQYAILPSMTYLRLTHRPIEAIPAEISKTSLRRPGKASSSLDIHYPSLGRRLNIIYESEAPFKIVSITDTYPSMFDKKDRSTTAVKTHELYDAYWSMNDPSDKAERSTLNISGFSGK